VITGIATIALADDKKEIPDHTGFKSCEGCHDKEHSMWQASGHSRSLSHVVNAPQASADCYGCHSGEGFAAKREGKKIDIADKASYHSIACLTCHDPRVTQQPARLVLEPDALCQSCHAQRGVLEGTGAKGIDDMRSFHSDVSCVSCHMSEGNHQMKVLRPDDPSLSANRVDTCTACHKDNNGKARAKQLQEWQADYKTRMDALQADLKAVTAALKDKPNLLGPELKAKLDRARGNVFILQRDESQGFHNFDFATQIMASASGDLKEVTAALK
jgi:predicted CXXCH cytochrome family protein